MDLLLFERVVASKMIKYSPATKSIQTVMAKRKNAPFTSKYVGITLDITSTFSMIRHNNIITAVVKDGTVVGNLGIL